MFFLGVFLLLLLFFLGGGENLAQSTGNVKKQLIAGRRGLCASREVVLTVMPIYNIARGLSLGCGLPGLSVTEVRPLGT